MPDPKPRTSVTFTPAGAPATKQHANACWAANPRLNPAAFREVLGHTAGKLWLDLRTYVPRADVLLNAWQQGLNAWLCSPRTLHALELPETIARESLVLCVESPEPTAPSQPVDFFFLRSEAPRVENFAALEQLVQGNHVGHYGLAASTPQPLHTLLALTEDATQAVWGRRKRPGLRALLVPLGFSQTAWLHQPVSAHHEQPVSALEHAARLGWAVVAENAATLQTADALVPLTSPTAPSPAAIEALEHAVAAEKELYTVLHGWPTVADQRLFSLLAHLGAGSSPFASPAVGLNWATWLLPDVVLEWQRLAARHPNAPIAPYIQALQRLAPHASGLGGLAAAGLTRRFFETLPAALRPAAAENAAAFGVGLVTSVPGVAGALVGPEGLSAMLPAMQRADTPDPSPYFPA